MKALSIQQPWADLIVKGIKDIENRKWSTRIRGLILIHAGKTFDRQGYDWVNGFHPDALLPKDEYALGGFVGYAVLSDCVTESESEWFFGPYGFVLGMARPCQFHPYKGQLGFFEVDAVVQICP